MTAGDTLRTQRAFRREVSSARAARDFVARTLRTAGAPDDVVQDFRLAASELAANAIEHGSGTTIDVTVEIDAECWELEVASDADLAALPRATRWAVAGPSARSGRGLGIVRELMDTADARTSGGRLVVRCGRRR